MPQDHPTESKTDQQVVDECNELAIKFCEAQGYRTPEGFRTHDSGSHPFAQRAWDLAVIAYDHIAGTCVQSALAGYDDDTRNDNAAYGRGWCSKHKVVFDTVDGKTPTVSLSVRHLDSALGIGPAGEVMKLLVEMRKRQTKCRKLPADKVEFETEFDAYEALGRVLKRMHETATNLSKITGVSVT